MKVYEAVETPPLEEYYDENNIKLFLAGGITDCEDWQSRVIGELNDHHCDNLIVFNPRRKTFDVTNPNESLRQIEWEYKYLNDMDMFTMYFANSKSNQPICMYELGRHLERMQHRFPLDWKDRIIIGIEDGYCREQDARIQSVLALHGEGVYYTDIDPEYYAQLIAQRYKSLKMRIR